MDICSHINGIKVDAIKKKLPNKLASIDICETCQMLQVSNTTNKGKNKKKNKKNKNQNTQNHDFEGLELCLACITLNCGQNSSQEHSIQHYKSKKHHIVINTSTLDLFCYTWEYSLTKLREEMDGRNKESERLDDIMDTVATLISGKTFAKKQPKKQPIIEKQQKQVKVVEEIEKQQNEEEITETEEQKENRMIHNALLNSAVDSIRPTYNYQEESALFCVRGLSNLGNTCFFNSTIQWLNATKDLFLMYQEKANGWYGNGYPLNEQFRKFLSGVRGEKNKTSKALAPKGMLNQICKKYPKFKGGQQHDAHELLINLLDELDTEAVKKKKKSIVDKAFGGTMMNSVLCLTCKNTSRTVQRFTDVLVDINFKEHTSGNSHSHHNQSYKNYNENKNGRQSKRDRKKNKNKKNRNNKKQAYFDQSWSDSMSVSYPTQNAKDTEPVLETPMLEYLISEDLLKSEENLKNPKMFYPIDSETTVLEEVAEESDQNRHSEAEGEDQAEGESWQAAGEDDTEALAQSEVTLSDVKDASEQQPEQINQVTINETSKNEEDWEIINIPQEAATKESTTEENTEVEITKSEEKETISEESEEESKSAQDELEWEEGEEFTRSNLDFDSYVYYEPFEQNQTIKTLSKAESLEDALCHFIKSEHLQWDYFWDTCNARGSEAMAKAVRKTLFLHLPQNLIVNFKRFSHTMYNIKKDSSSVSFPVRLCLDKYTLKQVPTDDMENIVAVSEIRASTMQPEHVYELYAVVCHSGGMSGGHYTAYVSYLTEAGRDWYYISDSHFQSVSESRVLNSEAYVLFYRKLNIDPK